MRTELARWQSLTTWSAEDDTPVPALLVELLPNVAARLAALSSTQRELLVARQEAADLRAELRQEAERADTEKGAIAKEWGRLQEKYDKAKRIQRATDEALTRERKLREAAEEALGVEREALARQGAVVATAETSAKREQERVVSLLEELKALECERDRWVEEAKRWQTRFEEQREVALRALTRAASGASRDERVQVEGLAWAHSRPASRGATDAYSVEEVIDRRIGSRSGDAPLAAPTTSPVTAQVVASPW